MTTEEIENQKRIDACDYLTNAVSTQDCTGLIPSAPVSDAAIQQSGIREKDACLILGIERDGRPIMNLSSQTVFEENDSVWVAGEYRQIVQLSEDSSSN